ncbi:MAG TPA: xanthine dehydrogenase family protein subunit M [Chloroflexota bacterium]|nr:xanthine dehydrogenase family protein subunit M [Chloroflexota bacterium]
MAPRGQAEALDQLATHGWDAKVLAGGQSLVPLMNFRLARPAVLVDINRISELEGVRGSDGRVTIGALTRQRDALRHPLVRQRLPLLADAIAYIGHPAIQNRGTVGGSLAHADPAAELPVVALALDAQLHVASARRKRTIAAADFTLGYLTTALAPDELLTSVSFTVPPVDSGWSFLEVARRHGDFALVAVAAVLGFSGSGRLTWARVALGGVGPVPLRATAAEDLLVGNPVSDRLFEVAADAARQAVEPEDDIHASADYRRHLAGVLVRRALDRASSRASHA